MTAVRSVIVVCVVWMIHIKPKYVLDKVLEQGESSTMSLIPGFCLTHCTENGMEAVYELHLNTMLVHPSHSPLPEFVRNSLTTLCYP